jgi:hypothetical protein
MMAPISLRPSPLVNNCSSQIRVYQSRDRNTEEGTAVLEATPEQRAATCVGAPLWAQERIRQAWNVQQEEPSKT